MNSIIPLPVAARRPRRSRVAAAAVAPGLGWIHDGCRYRVSVWPDVRFERELSPDVWVEDEMHEDAFASAALAVTPRLWAGYLDFAPAEVREFVEQFSYGRMAALHVITRCPALLPELRETPALTAFLALHLSLRGGDAAGWAEIGAVAEREGVFGVLQWLGLPASRQTVTILRTIADPDLPRRLLAPLRAALWEPEAIWALAHTPALTDARLAATCHAMAA
jgi:hypothetical protein